MLDKKQQRNVYRNRLKNKIRKKVLSLIGDKCIICGSQNRIQIHEIHGKKHMLLRDGEKKYYEYVKAHEKDFVSLCYYHHAFLHDVARKCNENEFFRIILDNLTKKE
jgi:hypothetical protein